MSNFAGSGGGGVSAKISYLDADPVALPNTGTVGAPTSILCTAGPYFRMGAATQSANRFLSFDPTGLADDEIVRVSSVDGGAFTLAILNGGPGAGTIYTVPANSESVDVLLKYDAASGNLSLYEASVASSKKVVSSFVQRNTLGGSSFATVTLDAALFPNTSTPTIGLAPHASGAGGALVVNVQYGATPGAHLAGTLDIDLGQATAVRTGAQRWMTQGVKILSVWWSAQVPATVVTAGDVGSPATAWYLQGTGTCFLEGSIVRVIANSLEIDGQVTSASLALGTSGAATWNANSGQNAHCLATGNVTSLTISNAGDGARLELEFVPGGSHFTLTTGMIFASGFSDAGLVTLCGTATRIILEIRQKRGVLYIMRYTGFAA